MKCGKIHGFGVKKAARCSAVTQMAASENVHESLAYACMSKDLQDGTILSFSSSKHSKCCNPQTHICVQYNPREKKTKQNLLKEMGKKSTNY